MVIGSVTDGYNPQEEQFGNTRKLLEQLIGSPGLIFYSYYITIITYLQ